jgi:hypothetical protein
VKGDDVDSNTSPIAECDEHRRSKGLEPLLDPESVDCRVEACFEGCPCMADISDHGDEPGPEKGR